MSEVKKYNAYAEGLTVHFELDSEGAWVAADDFDAQRLRADTAEAELKALKHPMNSAQQLRKDLAAAEKRIASHEKLLRRIAKHYERSDVRETHRAIDEIDAALNPNPEAESHE